MTVWMCWFCGAVECSAFNALLDPFINLAAESFEDVAASMLRASGCIGDDVPLSRWFLYASLPTTVITLAFSSSTFLELLERWVCLDLGVCNSFVWLWSHSVFRKSKEFLCQIVFRLQRLIILHEPGLFVKKIGGGGRLVPLIGETQPLSLISSCKMVKYDVSTQNSSKSMRISDFCTNRWFVWLMSRWDFTMSTKLSRCKRFWA